MVQVNHFGQQAKMVRDLGSKKFYLCYIKKMKKIRPEKCIMECSGNNRFYDIDQGSDFIPKEIKEKIEDQKIKGSFKRCGYCNTIWVNLYEFPPRSLKIGTKNMSSVGDPMHWFI
jgi:hypothetical protein